MLTISITVAVIVATLLLIVIANYRTRVREANDKCKEHNQWVGWTQRKDSKLKSQAVSDLLGGGDCTTVMSKLAKDRSELFEDSPTKPNSAWTDEDLKVHARSQSAKTRQAAMSSIRHFATISTIVTTTVCLLVSAGIYSFISRVPVSDSGNFNGSIPVENAPMVEFTVPTPSANSTPIASTQSTTGVSTTN
jgi:hypothetical protein